MTTPNNLDLSKLPKHIQDAIAAAQGVAPQAAPVATQTAPAAPAVAARPPATPQFDPNVMPDLNSIPDQSERGAKYLDYKEIYDIRATLNQVRHVAPTARSGPRFEIIFEVTRVDKATTIMVGTTRALGYFYNPYAFGKEKDKSDRSLKRFKEAVAGIMGQYGQKGFDADKAASELVSLSVQVPSIGIPLRLVNVEDGRKVDKDTGREIIYYNPMCVLATD